MKTLAALTLKAKIIIAAASAAVVAAGTVGTVMLLNNTATKRAMRCTFRRATR